MKGPTGDLCKLSFLEALGCSNLKLLDFKMTNTRIKH